MCNCIPPKKNKIQHSPCAGCGARSWDSQNRCEYCGGNVKKEYGKSVVFSGTDDPLNDSFKQHWVDCQMGAYILPFGAIHTPYKSFHL